MGSRPRTQVVLDSRATRHGDTCHVAGHSQDEAPMKATGRLVMRSPWEPAQGDAGLGGRGQDAGPRDRGESWTTPSVGPSTWVHRAPAAEVGRSGDAQGGDWLQSQRRFCADFSHGGAAQKPARRPHLERC